MDRIKAELARFGEMLGECLGCWISATVLIGILIRHNRRDAGHHLGRKSHDR